MLDLLAMAAAPKKPPIDVSQYIDEVTVAIWLTVALFFAYFLVRPELWRRMWFKRVDPRGAAMLRIIFGTAVLWNWLDLMFVPATVPGRPWIGKVLFTDEGLFMTDMARSKYGGNLKTLWDPEYGFKEWGDILDAMWGKFSFLHMRSDPPFVYGVFALLYASLIAIIVGWHTRTATVLAWFLSNSIYNYSPIFYTGGDTVQRTMLFLCMFVRWGEAYSLDSWRRRRKAILKRGAHAIPQYRKIPNWPLSLMCLQLAVIYVTTGWLKTGATWFNGSALYFALNLDHFYRFPATGLVTFLHWSKLSLVGTWTTHLWERFFFVAIIGLWVHDYERARANGTWPSAARARKILSWVIAFAFLTLMAYVGGLAAYYHVKPKTLRLINKDAVRAVVTGLGIVVPWALFFGYRLIRARFPNVFKFVFTWVLGKRVWLFTGLLFHSLIDISMNVGTFVQVTMAAYAAWLTAADVERLWKILLWNPAKPGEHGRPAQLGLFEGLWNPADVGGIELWLHRLVIPFKPPLRLFQRFLARLAYRVKPAPIVVVHGSAAEQVRRTALLRCWDVGERLDYREAPADDSPEGDPYRSVAGPDGRGIAIDVPGSKVLAGGDAAGRVLIRIMPGLWWLFPFNRIPGVGRLALRILRQRTR